MYYRMSDSSRYFMYLLVIKFRVYIFLKHFMEMCMRMYVMALIQLECISEIIRGAMVRLRKNAVQARHEPAVSRCS